MVLTAGSVTIKLVAGTYSSWAAFWNDLGNLTGNITCTVDASPFTEAVAPVGLSEELNGHIIYVKPASFPTKTDATDGARFTCNYAGNIISLGCEGAGTLIIEGIVFIEGTSEPINCFYVTGIGTDYNLIIRRNIVKGCGRTLHFFDDTLQSFQIYNNIFYDASTNLAYMRYDAASAIISNNTFVHCGDDNVYAGDEELNFKNNISYGATNNDWDNIEILTNGYNNADSDNTGENADWGGTGNNNVPGIGDPFNNLGADDFTIMAEGVVGKAGLDLSGDFTDDFFGVTRVNWTIGACEYISPGPANLKSTNAVATANIKSINAVLIANVKSINAIA